MNSPVEMQTSELQLQFNHFQFSKYFIHQLFAQLLFIVVDEETHGGSCKGDVTHKHMKKKRIIMRKKRRSSSEHHGCPAQNQREKKIGSRVL